MRVTLTATLETPGQSFTVRVAGVSHHNEDGASRQEIVRRCRPGQPVVLVREPENPHDPYAVAVQTERGEKIGHVTAGDVRLARHIDQGAPVTAEVLEVTGGPGLFGRLFPGFRKSYGCVLRITKHDPDWKAVAPWMEADRRVADLVREAQGEEKANPGRAVELYRQAAAEVRDLDAQGEKASAWRTTRHPINRLSLTLERMRLHDEALREIATYEEIVDRVGLGKADAEAVAKRKARLTKKVLR